MLIFELIYTIYMNKSKMLFAVSITVLVVSMSLHSLMVMPQADAQEVTPYPSREKTISVTGSAVSSVKPDMVIVQLGVETQEKTAKEALRSNSNMMSQTIDAIKKIGITEDEISTSTLNIYPVYEGHQDKETGVYTTVLVGYKASNILSIHTKKMDKAGDIIDAAVDSGVNRVDSIMFALSPETQLKVKDDLLEQAVLNAKSKAEKALSPLDYQIIGVKMVSLNESYPTPYPMPEYAYAKGAAMDSAPTQVFASNQDVSTTANVVFIIGSK